MIKSGGFVPCSYRVIYRDTHPLAAEKLTEVTHFGDGKQKKRAELGSVTL